MACDRQNNLKTIKTKTVTVSFRIYWKRKCCSVAMKVN